MSLIRATEIEFLRWFFSVADFGPAHSEVLENLCSTFVADMGKLLPEGYNVDASGDVNEFEESQ